MRPGVLSPTAVSPLMMQPGRLPLFQATGEEYTVSWSDDGSVYNSNDNATYWRGYAGYPVIAVMMMQGRLPLDRLEAERYADVNWKKINTEYHNNYSAALAEIEAVRDIDTRLTTEVADRVMARLSELPVTVRRGPLRPPR